MSRTNVNKLTIFKKGFHYGQDGPGNRLIYHLQGCNMHCPWCANPEGLSLTGTTILEHNKLLNTTSACFTAQSILLTDILEEALESQCLFIDGGGVTFSGGEPTLQFDALKELLMLLQQHHIHTAIETNGSHIRLPELFPYIDLLIMDLKHIEDSIHQTVTGISNTIIKENIVKAATYHSNVLIRTPLIQGFNSKEEYIDKFCTFYAACPTSNARFELLPYHEYGKEKWKACGLCYQIANGHVSNELKKAYEKAYLNYGFEVIQT